MWRARTLELARGGVAATRNMNWRRPRPFPHGELVPMRVTAGLPKFPHMAMKSPDPGATSTTARSFPAGHRVPAAARGDRPLGQEHHEPHRDAPQGDGRRRGGRTRRRQSGAPHPQPPAPPGSLTCTFAVRPADALRDCLVLAKVPGFYRTLYDVWFRLGWRSSEIVALRFRNSTSCAR